MFLPPVLVPGLDLGVSEVEGGRQLHAILDAQVLLPLEAALQLGQLVVREGRPGLPRLLEPDLRTVSAAGDLPVPFLFHWWTKEEANERLEIKTNEKKYIVRLCLTVLIRENLNLDRGIKSGKQIKIKSLKSSQLDIFCDQASH